MRWVSVSVTLIRDSYKSQNLIETHFWVRTKTSLSVATQQNWQIGANLNQSRFLMRRIKMQDRLKLTWAKCSKCKDYRKRQRNSSRYKRSPICSVSRRVEWPYRCEVRRLMQKWHWLSLIQRSRAAAKRYSALFITTEAKWSTSSA